MQGVLKTTLMAFYASASDFTRRLTSVKANGKFRPGGGPDSDWEEDEEALGEVVRAIKTK